MNAQYLILIEALVRDGLTESEIEAIVAKTVEEDVDIRDDDLDDLPTAA